MNVNINSKSTPNFISKGMVIVTGLGLVTIIGMALNLFITYICS